MRGPTLNPKPSAAEPVRSRGELNWGAAAPDEESFTDCLNKHLRLSGLSLNQLAKRSWLNISYVYRLANVHCDPRNPRLGSTADHHPSRDTVIRLGMAMQLTIEDMDELLLSTGYAPLVR